MDQEGNQVPVETLVARYAHRMQHGHAWQPDERPAVDEAAATPTSANGTPATVGTCPECRGDLIMMDGCPTCYAGCGWSKCG